MTITTARQEITAPMAINTTQRNKLFLEIPGAPPSLVQGALLANGTLHPITSFYSPLTKQNVSSLTAGGVFQIQTEGFSSVLVIPTDPVFFRLTTN